MQLITVAELKDRLSNGEKINLVDVREPSEHNEFNIGGTLIPLGSIQAMDVDQLEALQRSGTDLLLPQRKPERTSLSDTGYARLRKYKESSGRDACLAESLKLKA